jgi:hypothetical protein
MPAAIDTIITAPPADGHAYRTSFPSLPLAFPVLDAPVSR